MLDAIDGYTGQRGEGRESLLTKTQLRTTKTAELERLQAHIQEELDSRVKLDLERLKQDAREELLAIEERRLQLSERVMLGDAQALEEDRRLEERLRELASWLMRVQQQSKGPEASLKPPNTASRETRR